MKLENRTLVVNSQINNEEIVELVSKIVLEIENIDEIQVEDLDKGVATSALFALLQSIKKNKPEIKIPFFNDFKEVLNMGKVHFA